MVILALTYDGSLLTVINASTLLRLLPKLLPVRKPRFVNQSLTLNADTFCCRILSANRYSDDSSAVYRFTSLGRLKENFARFNWGIVKIGQDTNVQLRIMYCGFGCLVIETNNPRDMCLWRS